MARTLNLDARVTHADDLLIYRVLVRDQPAMVDLVHTVLGPLSRARDGAEPLLETLSAYFEVGGVATEAATAATSVRPGGHVSPGSSPHTDRLRPHVTRTPLHGACSSARRQTPRLAAARPTGDGMRA